MIANFPSLTDSTSVTPSPGESANLGSGSDLDPRISRWGTIGGLVGFLLWASTSPVGAPLHLFLHQRGPTQVVCLVAAGMIGAFLVSKWQLLARQQRKLQQLDQGITTLLRTGDIDAAAQRAEQSSSLVGKRLLRLLSVWRTSQSSFQLERAADADSDLYQLALQNSYSLVRVLLWAIPILGFIGTVVGLSQAIGSFTEVLNQTGSDASSIKSKLAPVVGGLATAFETTLVALLAAVTIQLLSTWVFKREEALLDGISDYTTEHVLSRLKLTDWQ